MDSAQKQLTDRLKTANNVLVTVSRNPSVDQLAACLGLTLLLNKQGKHAAAVFSGEVPSTLEFLKPEDTLEKNTDSLRDFIIALDRAKADKLRYKVEDNVVRIFITPYKTSISQDDLEFSEGDFNVDLVIALGVHQQEDLDEAITAHGRILHDATVASLNTTPDGGLGTINWYDPQASSLSELVTELAQAVGDNLLDNQIATALLTGIVSETKRFSNDRTSSRTMSISAALMAAGANQQLVASKLEEPPSDSSGQSGKTDDDVKTPDEPETDDGTIKIDHGSDGDSEEPDSGLVPMPGTGGSDTDSDQPASDQASPAPSTPDFAMPQPNPPAPDDQPASLSPGPKLVTEPPSLGGTLTANSTAEKLDPVTDPFSVPSTEPPQLLDHKSDLGTDSPPPSSPPAAGGFTPPPPAWKPPPPPYGPTPASTPPPTPPAPAQSPDPGQPEPDDNNDRTLTELEQSVGSPHVKTEGLDKARDEVNQALSNNDDTPFPEPIAGLGAQPMGGDLHPGDSNAAPPPADDTASSTPQVSDPTAPPPVPPPIPFQFGNPAPPPA